MHRPSLLRAASIVSLAFIASRALGLLRELVISAQFGTSADLDAYLAAFRIPDLLFQLIAGGALGSAFIPAFTAHLARGDARDAQTLAATVINAVLLLLALIAAGAAVAAPWLVATLVAPGFAPAQQALTAGLMRMMLVSTVVFGVSGVLMGMLNAQGHFLAPALAPVVYNLAIIGGAWWLGPVLGVSGLAIGVVAGAILHLLVQVPVLARYGFRWAPSLDLAHPGVREVARLMGPRVVGLAFTQINFLVNTVLASGLGAGALAALNYAWLVMLLPQGVVAQAMATALFPALSAHAARGETREMRAALAGSLRGLLFLMLPAAVGLLVAAEPLIGTLLQRGQFTAQSTALTAFALRFYALGLVGHAALEIVTRGFYALHDTRTPVAIGAAAMALNLLLSLSLIGSLSFGGLALANSIATLLETAALVWLLRARLGGLDGRALASAGSRTALAALVMGAAVYAFLALAGDLHVWARAAGALAVGGATYLGAAWLLRIPELHLMGRLLRRRAHEV